MIWIVLKIKRGPGDLGVVLTFLDLIARPTVKTYHKSNKKIYRQEWIVKLIENTIIPIITALLGAIAGYFLNARVVGKSEHNKTVDSIYTILMSERKGAEKGLIHQGPTEGDLLHLTRIISRWKRPGLKQSIDEYYNATGESNRRQNSFGEPFYTEPHIVVTAIDNLIKYVHRI